MRAKRNILIWAGLISIVLIFLVFPSRYGGLLYSGVNGGGAPAMLSFSTKGIALLLILIAEAIVFMKFLKISLGRAIFASIILNVFSAILGLIVALGAFSGTIPTIVVLGGYVLLSIRIFVNRDNLPLAFLNILIFTVTAGTVFVYLTAPVIPPQGTLIVYFLMVFPLLVGFGLSIMFETLICAKLLKVSNAWRGILAANIASYIVLALMVPLMSDNIYEGKQKYIKPDIVQKIYEGSDIPGIIEILQDYAAPNFYLLGLSEDNIPKDEYWAGMEVDILYEAYSGEDVSYPNPEYGLTIIEHVLSYPETYESQQNELEWLQKYFGYWVAVKKASDADNNVDYISATVQWLTWFQTNNMPDEVEDLPEPSAVMEYLSGEGNSD